MPVLGFGTGIFNLSTEKLVDIVALAARLGYRHFDCAQAYGTEGAVGEGLQRSGVPRADLFIATKLSKPSSLGSGETRCLVEDQLRKLQTAYVDLYSFHRAFLVGENAVAARASWRELEKLCSEGKICALGVSNHSVQQLDTISSFARMKPVVNQVKFDVFRPGYQHPKMGMENIICACRERSVHVVGYSTLSGWPLALRAVQDPHVAAMAERYDQPPARLLLRHALQRGIAVIPASANPDRMASNLRALHEPLISDLHMSLLDGLACLASRCAGAPGWVPDPYRTSASR